MRYFKNIKLLYKKQNSVQLRKNTITAILKIYNLIFRIQIDFANAHILHYIRLVCLSKYQTKLPIHVKLFQLLHK